MKYAFYVTTSKSGGDGQVNTQIDVSTDRKTYELDRTYRQTYRNIYHTSNWIGFLLDKNQIVFMTVKLIS